MSTTLTDVWHELVTTGLLGTDRRDPPALPPGPLADTVADALPVTPQGRLLAAVATSVVARRCGATPLPPRAALVPPEPDQRPPLPVAAVDRWRQLVTEWPVLEAEWLAVAASSGWRPAPDVLVALLRRHRRSPVLINAVLEWGGARAAWLVEHIPDLMPAGGRTGGQVPDARPLPVPAEIEPLLYDAPGSVAALIVGGMTSGTYRWSHRAVLLNVVARIDAAALPDLTDAVRAGRDAMYGSEDAAPVAVWEALIELATVRQAMLTDLQQSAMERRP